MTSKEFEQIKSTIESSKKKLNMAEGAKQKIEEQWKREFSIDTQEEVESKIKELNGEIEIDKKSREKLFSKLESVVDWSNL
jgi:hypothetical protein